MSLPDIHLPPSLPGQATASIWLTSVESAALTDGEAWHCLDEAERAHANRLRQELDRSHWIRARCFLRSVLGTALNVPPETLGFHHGPHGKPRLAMPDLPHPLHFNLSHSSGWAAIALSDREIGIDIEGSSATAGLLATADDVLTAYEMSRLSASPTDRRPGHFLALWTAKEALMKATGRGVDLPPLQIEVETNAQHLPIRYRSHPNWWLKTLWPKDDLVMSLSGPGTAGELALEWWPTGSAPASGK